MGSGPERPWNRSSPESALSRSRYVSSTSWGDQPDRPSRPRRRSRWAARAGRPSRSPRKSRPGPCRGARRSPGRAARHGPPWPGSPSRVPDRRRSVPGRAGRWGTRRAGRPGPLRGAGPSGTGLPTAWPPSRHRRIRRPPPRRQSAPLSSCHPPACRRIVISWPRAVEPPRCWTCTVGPALSRLDTIASLVKDELVLKVSRRRPGRPPPAGFSGPGAAEAPGRPSR